MSSRWAAIAAGGGGGSRSAVGPAPVSAAADEHEDEPANSASLQEAKSLQAARPRRTLVPFGRSSTLKSGSLQDLKFANLASGGGGAGGAGQVHTGGRHMQAAAAKPAQQQQRPKLLWQGSSRAEQPPPAGPTCARNPFRSSKSMLLLAQNQHIPQATAQLESFVSRQQADFMSYAQYAQAAAAAASQTQGQGRDQHDWPRDPLELAHPQVAPAQQQQQPHAMSHAQAQQPLAQHSGPFSSQYSSSQSISHQSQLAPASRIAQQAAGAHQQATADQSASTNAHSSEQCNEQDNEERPNCMQIMKKLFFSLVLGTIIAICWVMIIHTLKWIAIRGGGFELVQQQQAQQQTSAALGPANYQAAALGPPGQPLGSSLEALAPDGDGIHQANLLLLAHQAVRVAPAAGVAQLAPASAGPAGGLASPLEEQQAQQWRRRRRSRAHESGPEIAPTIKRRQAVAAAAAPPDGRPDDGAALSAAEAEFDKTRALASIEQPRPGDGHFMAEREKMRRLLQAERRTSSAAAATRRPVPPSRPSEASSEGDENDELNSSSNSDEREPGPLELPRAGQSAAGNSPGQVPPLEGGGGGGVSGAVDVPGEQVAASAQADPNALVYRAPFFTSWFVSIWNILFMPVFTLISSCCFRNEDSTTKKLLVESISQFMDNGLTTLQFLGRCAFFSVLWIGTIFGIVYSLTYLDATVVMALFACSAALVYLLSWVLLHQQFVGVRIVAVIICTTGIALLAYMDNSRTLGSVLIVAGSALCSAVYKVIYQRMFGFWSIAQMSLFFTLIGLFNAFLMWPLALLLYFLGVELIVWRHIPWVHLTAAGALHLTANIVAYFGPICSYDIFLTMGLLLAVVLSAVIDVTFYKITFFGMKLAGVLLLMIGFLVCLLPENWNECLYDLANERFVRWKKQRSMKKSRNKVQDMSTGQMSRLRTPSGRVK